MTMGNSDDENGEICLTENNYSLQFIPEPAATRVLSKLLLYR